jgi:hypothetical protein
MHRVVASKRLAVDAWKQLLHDDHLIVATERIDRNDWPYVGQAGLKLWQGRCVGYPLMSSGSIETGRCVFNALSK